MITCHNCDRDIEEEFDEAVESSRLDNWDGYYPASETSTVIIECPGCGNFEHIDYNVETGEKCGN